MKSKILLAFIMVASIASCKKSDAPESIEPESSFKVTNQTNSTVSEGQLLKLEDHSLNASSYHWDFGNGVTSDKADPNFYYVMHGDYTIKLTVTNAKGVKATSSSDIHVLCTFMNPNHNALANPTM